MGPFESLCNWLCEEHRGMDYILCINAFLKKGEKWIKYHVSGLPKSVAAGLCQVYVLTPTEARNPHPQPPPHVHTPHCFYMWETLLTGSDETKYIIGNSQSRSLWVYGGLINTSSIHPFPPQLQPPTHTSIKPSLRCHCTPSALFTAISPSRRRWCRSRGSLAYFPRVPFSFSFIFSFLFLTSINLCMHMNPKCDIRACE